MSLFQDGNYEIDEQEEDLSRSHHEIRSLDTSEMACARTPVSSNTSRSAACPSSSPGENRSIGAIIDNAINGI
jgi:hypothetical protein